jgi:medium-chain acyl-[acyl-carrier-protein] hydrolase
MVKKWVVTARPNPGARLRLFCLPYAGGGASAYRFWAADLPDTEVCAVQLPGRESRLGERPCSEMAPLISTLADVLLPECDRPFALFGHSMGALLAFELARQLQAAGGPQPVHLLVSGHRAPHLPRTQPALHGLPVPELIEQLRRIGGTPEAVLQHRELMELLLPGLRADFALVDLYQWQPGQQLACPLSAFCGVTDALAGPGEMEGWGQHTEGRFRLHTYPGGHFYLHAERQTLLRDVAADLGL